MSSESSLPRSRKVQRIGEHSAGCTIDPDDLDEAGVEVGDEVFVRLSDDGTHFEVIPARNIEFRIRSD